MNDNLRQFTFGFILLVLGAGIEELLPKFLGVGFPILLTVVQAIAVSATLPMIIILAIIAGALEEALSSLPLFASVSYFILVALLVRGAGLPRLSSLLTYPCYQLWLALWMSGIGAGVFSRFLLSLPMGVFTACVVGTGVDWMRRRGGVNERD